MELPYKTKFYHMPEIDVKELVNYFNLEFATESKSMFKAHDFNFVGVQIIDGVETMVWEVNNCKANALVKPYEDSCIIEMG